MKRTFTDKLHVLVSAVVALTLFCCVGARAGSWQVTYSAVGVDFKQYQDSSGNMATSNVPWSSPIAAYNQHTFSGGGRYALVSSSNTTTANLIWVPDAGETYSPTIVSINFTPTANVGVSFGGPGSGVGAVWITGTTNNIDPTVITSSASNKSAVSTGTHSITLPVTNGVATYSHNMYGAFDVTYGGGGINTTLYVTPISWS